MSLKGRLRLMLAVAIAGLLAIASGWITRQRSSLLSERMEKTRNLVEVPFSLLDQQYKLEMAGKLSRAQAQQRALEAIRPLRYDGSNYFWINDEHPTIVLHPMKPELEGKDLTSFQDPSGKAVFVAFVNAARASEGGYVHYLWPKPGKDQPVEKLSFVKRFEPWGWVIGTGIYIDDVDVAWRQNAGIAAALTMVCLAALLLVSLTTERSVLCRLGTIKNQIRDLAEGDGDLTKRIEGAAQDEVGGLATSLNTFMEKLHGLVASVAETAHQVASASAELSATSQQITANSEETTAQAKTVSQAGNEVNANLQTLSSGAEEMNATVAEIARNTTESAKIAAEAVTAAEATNHTVSKLGESSAEIGKVIEVITSIAQQTNLLALNATIEAARAGEAGKGFAVVANEVKELAKQTAKATEEIKGKITVIQENTTGAVQAIGGIRAVIDKISHISAVIATAVEQQSATTGEMARNVSDAARGAKTIVSNINGVAEAAQNTTANVGEAQVAAEHLARMANQLRELVGRFKLADKNNREAAASPLQAHRAAAGGR